jgi:uncharacterized repeat protein (TIGR01451 family)
MQTHRRELRDWFIITAIILIGFLCLIIAGSMAVRFAPRWELAANMDSNLDPNSDFLTRRPQGFIEPVDESVLTPLFGIGLFQTPGASVPPRTPLPTLTNVPVSTSTDAPRQTNPPTPTLNPTNTIIYYYPASPTNTQKPKTVITGTATPTLPVEADLQITKDDDVLMYTAGSTLTYTVIVTNNGPASAVGAVITDDIPVQFDNWTWECTAQSGSSKGCDPAASNNVNFSDTVDLPSGSSIQYTVTANISTAASGDLVNTASISAPPGITESDDTNNSFSDTDQFLAASPFPVGSIGDTKDGLTTSVSPGSSITFTFASPLVVNAHAGYDLVYYELPNGTGIAMDLVVLEIGDGTNWYTIFYWGDDVADTNSNMNIKVLGGAETDNRDFTSSPNSDILFNSTGVLIELDGVVPPGTYPYLRLISPPTAAYPAGVDLDGGCEADAIEILP